MDQLSYLEQIKFWLVAQFPQVDQYTADCAEPAADSACGCVAGGPGGALFIPRSDCLRCTRRRIFRKAVGDGCRLHFLNSLLPAFLLGFPAGGRCGWGPGTFEPAGS